MRDEVFIRANNRLISGRPRDHNFWYHRLVFRMECGHCEFFVRLHGPFHPARKPVYRWLTIHENYNSLLFTPISEPIWDRNGSTSMECNIDRANGVF